MTQHSALHSGSSTSGVKHRLFEEFATADEVQSFVCGHVRWLDGTLGPAIELEDIDWTTVDWNFVLKAMHAAL